MAKFTYQDLELAFQFAKDNPTLTIKDWIKENNKVLTDEERKLFQWIEMATINVPSKSGKDNHLYLINWNGVGGGHFSEPFDIFIRKHFGSHYQFWKESFSECTLITPDEDFFEAKNYGKSKEYSGVIELKLLSNEANVHILDHWKLNEKSEKSFYDFRSNKRRYENFFWLPSCNWEVYIDDIYKLKFEPILDLFEPEKKPFSFNDPEVKKFMEKVVKETKSF